ncbi:UDP-2,4-diacetamido-2,4,6-trideoxy-beta-L-altropyranose hydrolase [Cohnella candidum]|uniref:UDP-2,4-diacetamido-2,4, 6-trideoxy-beta-L-altropyranose hydrolase n=1 Tax=Cohnella candidum TaxID=2674991 RepID=A0A3G3K192_9BACL|nr:UDP-2,4-diacetamido-2,4,6-trideoxy-beta-L-altropyranose hydrolase [Cohnella candidum]AYQ73817.1 UDP-2,4-diacetamido-2,4,6-trideoxy-beta-L-altropyranose hydrolase [Cohnella candidum]
MKAAIRADASRLIGSGHVMRCLTLADRLRQRRQAEVVFLCREHDGNLIAYIRERGYEVFVLPEPAATGSRNEDERPPAHAHWLGAHWAEDAEQTIACLPRLGRNGKIDWLVVDHYALDSRYEEKVRPYVGKLMAIDDLADRPHDCDLLLDQNLDPDAGARYGGLIAPGTRLLVGPMFALLREEFAELRRRVRRDGSVRRLLVSFGGIDATGETVKALQALQSMPEEDWAVTVLAGKSNPNAERIAEFCDGLPNARFFRHAENVAELMLEADAAVGAGGSSTWERCCLGLPSLIVTTASNQIELTERVAQTGAVQWLGPSEEVGPDVIREALLTLRRHPGTVLRMSARAMELTDGLGADRIVEELVR